MHKLEIVSDLSKFIIIVYCGNVVITCDLVRFKLSNQMFHLLITFSLKKKIIIVFTLNKSENLFFNIA